MQNNNTLDFKRLLGFNQLSAITEPSEGIVDIYRLSNKIGNEGEVGITSDIGRLSNKISSEVAVFADRSESHKNLERLFNKIGEEQ